MIDHGVGLDRRCHINVIDWQLKKCSPSGKRCATYGPLQQNIKQGRKEEDYPIDRDRGVIYFIGSTSTDGDDGD